MADKEYICAYKHCLHHGEKVKSSEAVIVGKKYYHWDCAAMRQELDAMKQTYLEQIDSNTSYPLLSKVINDLIFKYKLDPDYVKFAIDYYAKFHIKIKSPFTLLYLRRNPYIEERWKIHEKGGE